MSLPIFGAQAAVSILNRVFTNTSPAASVFNNQVSNAIASLPAGTDSTDVLSYTAFAKAFGTAYASQSPSALSTLILTNMGLLPNDGLQVGLADYLTNVGKENVGIVALQLSSIISRMGSSAIYGAASVAWNSEVTSAFAYSSNPANTTSQTGDVTAPPANQGQTFTLTTNSDLVNGTAADESINGLIVTIPATGALGDTIQSVDIIDGGAGTDTLTIQTQAGGTLGATVKNVETVNYTQFAATQTFNMANVTGVTTLNNKNSIGDIVLTNVGAIMDLSVQSVAGSNTSVTYGAAAVAGAANVQKIALSGATADHTLNFNDGAIETYEITSSGSANRVVLKDLGATVGTIKVTGDQDFRVSFADTGAATTDNITSFDASAATGKVTADLFTAVDASNMTVKTGTGNDTVTFGNFTKDDSIDLGAGTDTLKLDLAATVSAAATLKGVEVLQLTANGNYTLNGSGATELTSVNVGHTAAGTRTFTLTNLVSTANTLNLNAGGNTASKTLDTVVFGLKTTSGTADALTINISNVDASGNAVVPTTKGVQFSSAQTANGIENITINSATLGADTSASVQDGGALLTLTADKLQKLTLVSSTLLDLDGSALADTVKIVDGSAANGGVLLNMANAVDATTAAAGATATLTVTTGSGADKIANLKGTILTTVTSGAGSDTISLAGAITKKVTIDAGAGNDFIDLSADNSTTAKELTLGDGVDTVKVNDAQSGITINDFVAGVGGDKISFAANSAVIAAGPTTLTKFNKSGTTAANDALVVISGDVTQGASATVAQIDAIQNIDVASYNATGDIMYVAFDDAANTYIAKITGGGAAGAAAGDSIVLIATLVGVTDATALTVDNFTNFLG